MATPLRCAASLWLADRQAAKNSRV